MCAAPLVRNGTRILTRTSIRETISERVQRWRCFRCRGSFSFRRERAHQHFAEVFIRETVKDFIQGRSSVAVIHERKGVGVGTISSWVRRFGDACRNPEEIAAFLGLSKKNRWSGILLLDAKYLNRRQLLLVAVDFVTLDIIAWLVVTAETVEHYTGLVDMVEACGYEIKALVSDGHPTIIALTQMPLPRIIRKGTRTYPRPGVLPAQPKAPRLAGIPHQWCVVHAERDIDRYLTKLLKGERTAIHALVHGLLFARTLTKARRMQKKLSEATALSSLGAQRVTRWIASHWELLTAHHTVRVGRRKIPRDTNAIENVLSYVNTRLKTMRRLRTTASSTAISNLIVVNYRTKPLQNSGNKLKRGKSPLGLAIGKNVKIDWMNLIKKSTA